MNALNTFKNMIRIRNWVKVAFYTQLDVQRTVEKANSPTSPQTVFEEVDTNIIPRDSNTIFFRRYS